MSNQNELNPAERELEDALRSLRPASQSIPDRDHLAFAAGQRTMRNRARLWQLAASALAASLLLVLILRPGAQTGDRIVYMPAAAPPAVAMSSDRSIRLLSDGYLSLRDRILDHGVDALPALNAAPGRIIAPTLFDRFDTDLHRPLDPGGTL